MLHIGHCCTFLSRCVLYI